MIVVTILSPNEKRAQQGARANDHGCHVSCSEQHEPRQPRSWLILNVRQKVNASPLVSKIASWTMLSIGGVLLAIGVYWCGHTASVVARSERTEGEIVRVEKVRG